MDQRSPPPVAPRATLPARPVRMVILAGAAAAGSLLPASPLLDLPPPLLAGLVGGLLGWAAGVPARHLERIAASLVLATWAVLKAWGLHASATDDNIYFYLATRWADGAVPYRDFFFAHPPVHLAVLALVFRLLGFSVLVAKLVPAVAQTVALIFLWRTARTSDRLAGLVVLGLGAVAGELLESSTTSNGQDVLAALAAVALWAWWTRRRLLAGAAAGLGLGSALYGLAGVATLVAGAMVDGARDARRLAGAVVAAVLAWLGAGLLMGRQPFIEAVFRYHVEKAPAGTRAPVLGSEGGLAGYLHNLLHLGEEPAVQRLLLAHTGIVLGAVVALVAVSSSLGGPRTPVALIRQRTPAGLVLVAGAGAGLGALMYAGLPRLFSFYFVPAVMWLVLGAGVGLALLLRELLDGGPGRAGAAAALLGLWSLHVAWAAWLTVRVYPEEGVHAGEVVRFEFREPEHFPWLGDVVRAALFRDRRVRGEVLPAWQNHVARQLQRFSTAGRLAGLVAARTAPHETITGASTVAPLVALLAGRRMAADEADTNSMRFTTGSLTHEDLWRRACADAVRYVVSAPRSAFDAAAMAGQPALVRGFVLDAVVEDPHLLHSGPVRLSLHRRPDSVRCPP